MYQNVSKINKHNQRRYPDSGIGYILWYILQGIRYSILRLQSGLIGYYPNHYFILKLAHNLLYLLYQGLHFNSECNILPSDHLPTCLLRPVEEVPNDENNTFRAAHVINGPHILSLCDSYWDPAWWLLFAVGPAVYIAYIAQHCTSKYNKFRRIIISRKFFCLIYEKEYVLTSKKKLKKILYIVLQK